MVTKLLRCPVCLQGGGNPLEWFAKLNPFDKQRRDGENGLRDERESITRRLLKYKNACLVDNFRNFRGLSWLTTMFSNYNFPWSCVGCQSVVNIVIVSTDYRLC